MAQRTLSLAEKDLLPDRGHVRRSFDIGDVDAFFRRRQRGHLGNGEGDECEQPEYDRHKADDTRKLRLDEQEDHCSEADDAETDQLQFDYFTHRAP